MLRCARRYIRRGESTVDRSLYSEGGSAVYARTLVVPSRTIVRVVVAVVVLVATRVGASIVVIAHRAAVVGSDGE